MPAWTRSKAIPPARATRIALALGAAAYRACPRLVRSPLGYPLRLIVARVLLRSHRFDIYGLRPSREPSSPFSAALAALDDDEAASLFHPLPDSADYLRDNPDVARKRVDPTAHYLWRGRQEGRAAPAMPATIGCPDFTQLPTPADAPSRVCVIIPVHGARAETLRCLHSVLAAPNRTPFRVLVIDDASPDPSLPRDLADLARGGRFALQVQERNRGFSATVNAGLATLGPDEDAILLNSDAQVFGDWIDRLAAIAAQDPRVGTISPLSNSATILSYPIRLRDNPAPLETPWSALDAIAKQIGHAPVDIPTAIGSCMYIRSGCLSQTGPMNAAAFPQGYGEENDFCRRALRHGWVHRAAANIFVHHEGAASFGGRRAALVQRGLAILRERYPDYDRAVADHIADDPLRRLRERIDCARILGTGSTRTLWHWTGETPDGFEPTDLRLLLRADGTVRLSCPAVPVTPNLPDIKLPHETNMLTALLAVLGVQNVRLGGLSWLGGHFAALSAVAAALDIESR